jgi:hypothetical protein
MLHESTCTDSLYSAKVNSCSIFHCLGNKTGQNSHVSVLSPARLIKRFHPAYGEEHIFAVMSVLED